MLVGGIVSVRLAGAPVGREAAGSRLPLDPNLDIATEPLWTGAVPGAKGPGTADTPTLTVFQPQPGAGNGTAVVIAPGGAYLGLASNLEGRQVADWFAARGTTAFVLHYRLGARYLYPVPLEDAQRAIRWVRYYAPLYRISRDRIGMVGFSAGGHLAAMAGTVGAPGTPHAADPIDRGNSRPDFLVLGYPWLNAMEPSHPPFIPSYEVLAKVPKPEWKRYESRYTPAALVTAATPPTFIYCTADDSVVPVQADLRFFGALVSHRVPAEMHIFRHGGHGSGLGYSDPSLDQWPNLLLIWLDGLHLLTAEPSVVAAAKTAHWRAERRPGEPLDLESSLGAVLQSSGGRAVLRQWLGEGLIERLPGAASSAPLRVVIGYRIPALSAKQIEALSADLAHVGRS